MSRIWQWTGPYIMVIVWALLLGALLSRVPLVRQTLFGTTSLGVSNAIRTTSYGFALFMIGMLAFRTTRELSDDGTLLGFLRGILRPLTALVLLFVGFKILMEPDSSVPLPRSTVAVHWMIVAAMATAALWLTVAWVRHSGALIASFERYWTADHDIGRIRGDQGQHGSAWRERAAIKAETEATVVLPRPGYQRTLGRYRLLKELGRGSMGVVYLGEDPTIHRHVAIKTMRLDRGEDPEPVREVKARFFHEAESTGRLSHPNIVTIYDAGEEDDLGYIAMEFLEGTTLKAWCRKDHRLPAQEAVNVAAIVAEALDYAHRQGIVHRDIKPSNIMLTVQHAVKVTDFGIARITTSTKTQTTMIMGTPSYMAPEQVVGAKVDGRADIFSLGVVLFELLTSAKPFDADNITALLFKIAHEPPQPLTALRSDVPAPMEAIIQRALQKEPGDRYQYARELARDLRACAEIFHA